MSIQDDVKAVRTDITEWRKDPKYEPVHDEDQLQLAVLRILDRLEQLENKHLGSRFDEYAAKSAEEMAVKLERYEKALQEIECEADANAAVKYIAREALEEK